MASEDMDSIIGPSLSFFKENLHLLSLSVAIGVVITVVVAFLPVPHDWFTLISLNVLGPDWRNARDIEFMFFTTLYGSLHRIATLAIYLIYAASVYGYLGRRDRSVGSAIMLLHDRAPRLFTRLLLYLLLYAAGVSLLHFAVEEGGKVRALSSLLDTIGPLVPVLVGLPFFFIVHDALFMDEDYDALEIAWPTASRAMSSAPAVIAITAVLEMGRVAWQPASMFFKLLVKDWEHTGFYWHNSYTAVIAVTGELADYVLFLPFTAVVATYLYMQCKDNPLVPAIVAEREALYAHMASLKSYYGSYQYQPVQEGW